MVVLGFVFFAYQTAMIFVALQGATQHYSIHLVGVLLISSLVAIRAQLEKVDRSKPRSWLPLSVLVLLATVAVGVAAWYRVNVTRLELASPFFTTPDIVLGLSLVTAIVGLTWMVWGTMVAVTIIIAILYFFLGHLIPGVLGHQPLSVPFVTAYLGLSPTQGLFFTTPLSADVIFFLLVFGVFLSYVGLNRFFFEVGKAVGNLFRGGIAYTAVVGSGLVATVTGLGLSNAAIIGPTVIDPMIRAGFKPHLPAAILATAAQGGQITPPIMGVAAFFMAAFLNKDYIEIAMRGVIPAFLYYLSLGLGVFFLTRTHGIPVKRESVDWSLILRVSPTFFIPLILIVVLLVQRFSPMYAGFYGIVAVLALSLLQGRFRPSFGEIAKGLTQGVILAAQIGLIVIAIGPLAQASITTNFGTLMSNAISGTFLAHNLLLALITFMLLNIFLGTGLPTLGAYVILALTVVPSLQDLGVDALAAHFFVFYFAALADITPPIALTVNLTCRMAGASFMITAVEAMKLAVVAFIVPFVFVYNPVLLDFPNISTSLLVSTAIAIVSTFALSVSLYGYFLQPLNLVMRLLFGVVALAGFLYIATVQLALLLTGLGLLAAVILRAWLGARQQATAALAAAPAGGDDPSPPG